MNEIRTKSCGMEKISRLLNLGSKKSVNGFRKLERNLQRQVFVIQLLPFLWGFLRFFPKLMACRPEYDSGKRRERNANGIRESLTRSRFRKDRGIFDVTSAKVTGIGVEDFLELR